MRLARSLAAVAFLLVLVSALTAPLAARTDPAAADTPVLPPDVAAPAAAADEEVVPATAAAAGPVAVPVPSETAMRYYRSGNWLWILATLWGFAVPALLLFTGVSARLRDLARRLGRRWFLTVALYGVLFALVGFLLDLPLSWYSDYVRPHAYGLSDQAAAKWWGDAFKGLAIGALFNALFLWVPYLLLKKSPRRWWIYTGLLAVPFVILMMVVTPIWIDPLFNEFGPMKDRALEAEILSLADRAGIEGGRVYEVAKSVDTNTVNAYVTGFLDTKRIVLWDTLLAKLEPSQVLFVMGHEMGHYVLGHVPVMLAVITVLIFFGLWVVHRSAAALIARFRHRFGFEELGDVASLPLIGLLFGLVFFVLSPGFLALSRHHERQSDRFGLEITRDNVACATSFVRLQEENLGNPRPGWLYKLWRSSHPPLGERIDFCNAYRPWETGAPLAYGEKIRPPV
ncbi:MAG: M48 family metallopeptidase [Thermoanaerobaculia bacterium]|nr:M48 family metallopeptidase [Thermoanaerobaculia bacterium]MCZ7650151.1 M48 family metallopeptidase [Thermoanaerobaculia bacterium]